METMILKVGGMSCGGCVKSVKDVLEAISGVTRAEVSLERAEAVITCDPARVDRAQLRQAIDEAGFEAS
jgi:copper chaperone